MKILYNEMVVYYSCILRLRTIKKRKEYASSGFIWDIFEQNIPDYIFLCYFLIRQLFLFLLFPPPLFRLSLILSFPFLHAASSVIEQPSFFPSPIVAFFALWCSSACLSRFQWTLQRDEHEENNVRSRNAWRPALTFPSNDDLR